MNTVLLLLILSFASYRITRFFIIDTLLEGSRNRLHVFLGNQDQKPGRFRFLFGKVLDLSSCTWCLGFWTSLIIYSLYFWTNPLDFTRIDVINVFAIAGIQGLLSAFEPDED